MIRLWIARTAALALVVAGLPLALTTPAAAATQWIDGIFRQSQIVNCASIIWGSPYSETGVMTYVGYQGDLSSTSPKPALGDTFYVHVVVGSVGNSCAGQYVQPAISLPSGLSVSGTARCWYTSARTNTRESLPCGAVASGGAYYFGHTDAGQTTFIWPAPQGLIEFELPVRAGGSATVTGQLQGTIDVADGNSNPKLTPTQSVLVLPASSAGVMQNRVYYPSPSTVVTPGVSPQHRSIVNMETTSAGRGYFDIGTSPGTYQPRQYAPTFDVGTAGGWRVWADWNAPSPGTRFYWRFCFDPTGIAPEICGTPEQSFIAISGDSSPPSITSLTVLGPQSGTATDPITGKFVSLRLTFSEKVSGVWDALAENGPGVDLSGQPMTTLSPASGPASTYTITMASGVGVGRRNLMVLAFANKISDEAGNLLGTGVSKEVYVNRPTADTTRPTITTSSLAPVSLGSTVTQTWTASDNVGLASFSVQSRAITTSGSVGAWTTPPQTRGSAARSASVATTPGTTRCIRVIASDTSALTQSGAVHCTTSPHDDRATVVKSYGAWRSIASSSSYNGTLSRSTVIGAKRYITGAKVKRVFVVVQKRPGAGSIDVYVKGVKRNVSPISLAASSTRSKQVITITLPVVVTSASVVVVVRSAGASGGGVAIDGMGVSPS